MIFQIGMSVEVFQSIQYAFRQIFEWKYGRDVICDGQQQSNSLVIKVLVKRLIERLGK